MKLWLVLDYEGWGYSHNLVRAETKDDAYRLALGRFPRDSSKVEVLEFPLEGPEALLWTYDHSPDTGPDG